MLEADPPSSDAAARPGERKLAIVYEKLGFVVLVAQLFATIVQLQVFIQSLVAGSMFSRLVREILICDVSAYMYLKTPVVSLMGSDSPEGVGAW